VPFTSTRYREGAPEESDQSDGVSRRSPHVTVAFERYSIPEAPGVPLIVKSSRPTRCPLMEMEKLPRSSVRAACALAEAVTAVAKTKLLKVLRMRVFMAS
jgi:hypothetical protein